MFANGDDDNDDSKPCGSLDNGSVAVVNISDPASQDSSLG